MSAHPHNYLKTTKTVFNYYPVAKICCFSLILRVGTIIISLLGIVMGAMYVLQYISGEDFLNNNGVDGSVAKMATTAYLVVGIFVILLHFNLFVATYTFTDDQVLIYLWGVVIYFIVDIVLVLSVSIVAIISGNMLFGVTILVLDILYWIAIFLFILPVVNGFRRSIYTVVIKIV